MLKIVILGVIAASIAIGLMLAENMTFVETVIIALLMWIIALIITQERNN